MEARGARRKEVKCKLLGDAYQGVLRCQFAEFEAALLEKKACASSTPVRTPYSFRVADNGVGVIDEIARRLMICAYLKRDYVIDKVVPLRLS